MVPPAAKLKKANGHAVQCQRYKVLLHTMSEITNDKIKSQIMDLHVLH